MPHVKMEVTDIIHDFTSCEASDFYKKHRNIFGKHSIILVEDLDPKKKGLPEIFSDYHCEPLRTLLSHCVNSKTLSKLLPFIFFPISYLIFTLIDTYEPSIYEYTFMHVQKHNERILQNNKIKVTESNLRKLMYCQGNLDVMSDVLGIDRGFYNNVSYLSYRGGSNNILEKHLLGMYNNKKLEYLDKTDDNLVEVMNFLHDMGLLKDVMNYDSLVDVQTIRNLAKKSQAVVWGKTCSCEGCMYGYWDVPYNYESDDTSQSDEYSFLDQLRQERCDDEAEYLEQYEKYYPEKKHQTKKESVPNIIIRLKNLIKKYL